MNIIFLKELEDVGQHYSGLIGHIDNQYIYVQFRTVIFEAFMRIMSKLMSSDTNSVLGAVYEDQCRRVKIKKYEKGSDKVSTQSISSNFSFN
jgi:hypothetical protein